MCVVTLLKLLVLLITKLALLDDIKRFFLVPYGIDMLVCLLAEFPGKPSVTDYPFVR